jgi:hypothetical protein
MTKPSSRSRRGRPALDRNREEVQKLTSLFQRHPLTVADYHAIGEQMARLADDKDVTTRGSNWKKKVAELVGSSESTLTKCLQFYEAYKEQEDDLAELQELHVPWMHLVIALGISDKEKRHRLLRRARDKNWSQDDLRHEARQMKGTYRGGGRKLKVRKSRGCLADASRLVRLTGQWAHFYQQAWDGNEKKYLAELDRLTDKAARAALRGVLDDAEKKLQVLQGQCQSTLKTVQALRKKFPGRK